MNVFDRLHPAPGVKVLPCPMSKSNLSHTQAANRRRDDDHVSWHVMKPTKRCEPTGLGMPSTVRTVPSMVLATPGAPGTVRPGSRRRGHKKAPCNLGFSSRIKTQAQYHELEGQQFLARLRGMHTRIVTATGDVRGLEDNYEKLRLKFVREFPLMKSHLARMEEVHESTLAPSKKGTV